MDLTNLKLKTDKLKVLAEILENTQENVSAEQDFKREYTVKEIKTILMDIENTVTNLKNA